MYFSQQSEKSIKEKLILGISISYFIFIISLFIISLNLLISNIKFLLTRFFPSVAAIIDSLEFIDCSLNYKYCDNNIYNLSPIHRIRLSLFCIANEIFNNSKNIVDTKIYKKDIILSELNLNEIKSIKIEKFYDPIVNNTVLLYTNMKLNNIYDNFKFDYVINYINIFYNLFGKLNHKINMAIIDRCSVELNEKNINNEILKRIYLFWKLCNYNNERLYKISNKNKIDSEIYILYKFIKENIYNEDTKYNNKR